MGLLAPDRFECLEIPAVVVVVVVVVVVLLTVVVVVEVVVGQALHETGHVF